MVFLGNSEHCVDMAPLDFAAALSAGTPNRNRIALQMVKDVLGRVVVRRRSRPPHPRPGR